MCITWRWCACVGFLLLAVGRHSTADLPSVLNAIKSKSLFFETFDSGDWQSRWIHSRDSKYNGRFTTADAKGWTDKGLKIPEKNKFYGIAALLEVPVDPVVARSPEPLPLVVQYEVKYEAGVTCGGAYLKLLTADPGLSPEGLLDSTPYSIMFGPDRCGATSKIHLILRHRNPVNGSISEKHLASPPSPESNDYTHVYTLRIFPDHRYEVLVDGSVRSSGSLIDASTLQPPLLPARELLDPEDKKPADWVDLSEIPDPDAVKPADWDDRAMIEDDKAVKPKGWLDDEPSLVDDPAAKRPEDWDNEEDGIWEPNQIPNPKCKVGCGPWQRPMKPNPAYKGEWKPPLVKNPAYKGPWVQKTIPNPDFYEDAEPVRSGVGPIGGVALELWTVDSGYMFDNILITRDPAAAELAVKQLWTPRHDAEVKAFEAQLKEEERKEKERKKEEKEKKKKARKAGRYSNEQLRQLTESVLELFEDGALLAPLAPFLRPLLDHLSGSPESIVLLIGLGPLLGLGLLVLLRGSGSGRRKRQLAPAVGDVGGAADGRVAEEEVEAEPATGAEPEAAAGEGAAADPGATGAAGGQEGLEGEEVVAGDEEIEEDEPSGPERRGRTPRAA